MFRIGHGYDVHKIIYDKNPKPLILAGIKIKANFFLEAYSDGDIIFHALTDALLGTLGLGDIGTYFTSNELVNKNRSSKVFMLYASKRLKDLKYNISNIDITIISQIPKISPYVQQMNQSIATLLQLNINQVNIKASTTDYLGFIGRKEGMACHAITLVSSKI